MLLECFIFQGVEYWQPCRWSEIRVMKGEFNSLENNNLLFENDFSASQSFFFSLEKNQDYSLKKLYPVGRSLSG